MSGAGKEAAEVRIVKKGKQGHGGHHGGAWKVAYADFVTAMMAFFLVMWIMGLSQEVKSSVAGYFKDPVGFMKAVRAGNAPFETPNSKPGGNPAKPDPFDPWDRKRLAAAKEILEKIVASSPEFSQLKNHVDIKLTNEGLQINLLETRESMFFDAASAKIKPATRALLAKIASELRKMPNRIVIEGHTDPRPLSRGTPEYTNWELSADRANAARRVMEPLLLPRQIEEVRGYADRRPRDVKNPTHFSNRRVTIMVRAESPSIESVPGSQPSDLGPIFK
jgi:chemotaxis protein MotB